MDLNSSCTGPPDTGDHLHIPLTDLRIVSLLGRGSNGTVYKVYDVRDSYKKYYALKEVKMQNDLTPSKRKACLNEVTIMKRV